MSMLRERGTKSISPVHAGPLFTRTGSGACMSAPVASDIPGVFPPGVDSSYGMGCGGPTWEKPKMFPVFPNLEKKH